MTSKPLQNAVNVNSQTFNNWHWCFQPTLPPTSCSTLLVRPRVQLSTPHRPAGSRSPSSISSPVKLAAVTLAAACGCCCWCRTSPLAPLADQPAAAALAASPARVASVTLAAARAAVAAGALLPNLLEGPPCDHVCTTAQGDGAHAQAAAACNWAPRRAPSQNPEQPCAPASLHVHSSLRQPRLAAQHWQLQHPLRCMYAAAYTAAAAAASVQVAAGCFSFFN